MKMIHMVSFDRIGNTLSSVVKHAVPVNGLMVLAAQHPILHILVDSYSSCVNQPVQRLFMAISALKNNLLFGGDAVMMHTLMHG
jgi:hypothetical protein